MASSDWLRTFLAVYRVGSVTDGARQRDLSQPAASQQVAALERAVGGPLFVRSASGVAPTPLGRELYARVADPLDRLEPALRLLEGTPGRPSPASLRLGTTVEYFSARILPRLGSLRRGVTAAFGDATTVMGLLRGGEVDVALATGVPARRHFVSTPLAPEGFALVTGTVPAPPPLPGHLEELGPWLAERPWVAYSHELPVTRRFFQQVLGRPFDPEVRLVAPDLRVVAAAVEAGMGTSLLPTFVVSEGLARGSLVEVFPVGSTVPAAPWFACTLESAADRLELEQFVTTLSSGAFSGAREAPPSPA